MPRLGTLTSFKLAGVAVRRPRVRALVDVVSQVERILPTGITTNSSITKLNPFSAKFDGSNSANMVIPVTLTTPITIDCYMYATKIPMNGLEAPWGLSNDANNSYVAFQRSNNPQVYTQQAQYAFGSGQEFLNTWVHIAMVIRPNDFSLYFDGTLARSTEWISPYSNFSKLILGKVYDTNASCFNGHLDEIRISSGERYTGNFTPPTSAYTVDANTLALYRTIDYQP